MFDPPTVALDEIDSVLMIGVGGSGMSGIAKLLAQRGIRVTGSDVKPSAVLDSLAGVGVETWIGHRPDRIADVDVVVASSAVPDQDPEMEAARRAGVTTARRPALLRGVTVAYPTIGFSGTHGKTSSTAMAILKPSSMWPRTFSFGTSQLSIEIEPVFPALTPSLS